MRDYGKVGPKFWIGQTGKLLRAAGPDAQIVAMYLLTCPHANMLGLYYVSIPSIAHETGRGFEGASKGLAGCIEAGFCSYDEATEMVWVHEMAAYQIATSLKATDLRAKGVQSEYDSLPSNPYLKPFFEKYAESFHMTNCRNSTAKTEAPSKPLASQEQEQEQEQKKDQELFCGSAAAEPPEPEGGKPAPSDPIPYQAIVDAYNTRLTQLSRVILLNPGRRAAIRKAWHSLPAEHRQIGAFKAIFAECALDHFLNGNGPYSGEHANWRPDFDHLIKTKTLTKVYEKAMARRDKWRKQSQTAGSEARA